MFYKKNHFINREDGKVTKEYGTSNSKSICLYLPPNYIHRFFLMIVQDESNINLVFKKWKTKTNLNDIEK